MKSPFAVFKKAVMTEGVCLLKGLPTARDSMEFLLQGTRGPVHCKGLATARENLKIRTPFTTRVVRI